MKILKKIITAYLVIASFAIALKLGDNMLANASTSNVADQCGINNGWVWNGRECVNTCDASHPWDSNTGRCSNTSGSSYYYTNYSSAVGNCNVYGSNFYFNGTNCVQTIPGQNISYNGSNPYNGGYFNINNSNINQNYYPYNNYNNNYTNQNTIYTYNNTNTNDCYYYNNCNTCSSCWVDPAPKVITTYETHYYTEYIPGIPMPSYGIPNNNYYNNTGCWYNGNNNYCGCNDYTNMGYYDQYGYYHF